MIEDEIVQEVRATREAFAAAHGYDIHAMIAALRQISKDSGRDVVTHPSRAVRMPKPMLPQNEKHELTTGVQIP